MRCGAGGGPRWGERGVRGPVTPYSFATRTPTSWYFLVGCDGGRRISLRPSRGMGCVCVYVCDSFLFCVVFSLLPSAAGGVTVERTRLELASQRSRPSRGEQDRVGRVERLCACAGVRGTFVGDFVVFLCADEGEATRQDVQPSQAYARSRLPLLGGLPSRHTQARVWAGDPRR